MIALMAVFAFLLALTIYSHIRLVQKFLDSQRSIVWWNDYFNWRLTKDENVLIGHLVATKLLKKAVKK